MHVSSVEDTIRPEIFEAPLRSAQSFWNPSKHLLTDSYIPVLHRSWYFLPSQVHPEFMSSYNHDTSWYDVDALAPYVCVPGLLLLLQTPPAVLRDPVNPNSLLTHNHNLTALSPIYSLVMLAQITWHPNQWGLLRLRMSRLEFQIYSSLRAR